MVALETTDIKNDFKRISDIVNSGESVLITRPFDENLVVLSERVYNELEKVRRNNEYFDKIDRSLQQLKEGRVVIKTMEELEAMAE
jgi:antitoxin YefM